MGCAVERGVKQGNIFYSTSSPNITVQVDGELASVDPIEVDKGTSSYGDWADTAYWTIYPFISTTPNKYIDKAVLIRFGSLKTSGSRWVKVRGAPQVKLDGVSFTFQCGRFYDRTLVEMIRKEGYRTDRSYAAALWDRIVNDQLRMHILYVEMLPKSLDNQQWPYPDKWSAEQKRYMQEVIQRGQESFTILNFSAF
jgi:hypothetical protein